MPYAPFSSATLRALSLCVLSAWALPTTAQTGGAAPQAPAASAAPAALTMAQVIERLGSQGFNDFKEIERKGDKLFEVKARDAQRVRVELLVDARTGEILKSKIDK